MVGKLYKASPARAGNQEKSKSLAAMKPSIILLAIQLLAASVLAGPFIAGIAYASGVPGASALKLGFACAIALFLFSVAAQWVGEKGKYWRLRSPVYRERK